jgi:hypothetical protein
MSDRAARTLHGPCLPYHRRARPCPLHTCRPRRFLIYLAVIIDELAFGAGDASIVLLCPCSACRRVLHPLACALGQLHPAAPGPQTALFVFVD